MRFFTVDFSHRSRFFAGSGKAGKVAGRAAMALALGGVLVAALNTGGIASGVGFSSREQNAMVAIAEQLCPAVVYIENIGDGNMGGGSGSGVIISAKGYIVTNYHVIADAVALDVYLSDGRKASGQLIGSDSSVDLALLKIDLPDLAVAKLGNSDNLAVGQLAFAIGNPGGAQFTRSMTMGLISGLNRELELPDGNIYNLIQTDAAINPGNSGGPLVDIYGEVIGITSIKIVDTYFEGMGFAIPIATVVRVIDELAIPISTSIW